MSGGDDGRVCVWSRRSRQLVLQFSEHKGPVLAVRMDILQDHLVHSVGADRSIYTYDLRQERRIVGHQVRSAPWSKRATHCPPTYPYCLWSNHATHCQSTHLRCLWLDRAPSCTGSLLWTLDGFAGLQVSKSSPVGSFLCMSQRVDSEQELVTGGADGKLLFWDCDVISKPVLVRV